MNKNVYFLLKILLLFLWFSATSSDVLGQKACSAVTASDIISNAATCPGNGSITVPSLTTEGYFTLEGGSVSGVITQDDNTFESLNAGTYTLKLSKVLA